MANSIPKARLYLSLPEESIELAFREPFLTVLYSWSSVRNGCVTVFTDVALYLRLMDCAKQTTERIYGRQLFSNGQKQ